MNTEHKEVVERVERRLDIIEKKLDKHLELVAKHEADLNWIKGSMRIGAGLMASIISGLLLTITRVFFQG